MWGWAGAALSIARRLAICWGIGLVCFLISLQIQLLEGRFTGGGLAFDLPMYWSLPDMLAVAASFPAILLPFFVGIEIARALLKRAFPFRIYAVFVVTFFVAFTAYECADLAGVFVRLWEISNLSSGFESAFFTAKSILALVVSALLAYWMAWRSQIPSQKTVSPPTS